MGTEPPEGEGWERDPDVLDTWFSSGLWPFATLGWPEDTPELRAFHPTDVLSTARDILFLWVARMVMLGLRFTGEIPFADVYIHSVIQAPDGRRMSKSLGTGVDPLALIDGGPRPRGVRPRRGLPRLRRRRGALRPARHVLQPGRPLQRGEDRAGPGAGEQALQRHPLRAAADRRRGHRCRSARPRTVEDRWILSRLDAAKDAMRTRIDDFDFAKAALGLYDYIYGDLCDWYLEMVKPRLYAEDDPDGRARSRGHAAPRPARDAPARAPDHPVRHRGAVGDARRGRPAARPRWPPPPAARRATPRPRRRWAVRSPR